MGFRSWPAASLIAGDDLDVHHVGSQRVLGDCIFQDLLVLRLYGTHNEFCVSVASWIPL